MEIVSITSKGQMTIPSRLRRELGIKQGDKLTASVIAGELVVKPLKYKTLANVFSAVKSTHYVSDEEVRKIVRESVLRENQS